jgi:cytoskeletal protein CcmA (bactofilin family)
MSDAKKQTVIEEGTDFDGSINSRCAITLSGTMKGELLAPALTVTPSGTVNGRVKVEQLVSHGEVSGEIEAQSVELSGKVSDQTVINADTLEVRLSQPEEGIRVTFGNCELRVGDRPANIDSKPKKTEKEPQKLETEPTL